MSIPTKVLITGASGFVGANLTRKLLREGYEVHIFSQPLSNNWRLTDILPKLNVYTVDLLQEKRLKELVRQINPEAIFHLAAVGVFGGILPSEKKLIKTNVLGTVNLINACNEVDYKCFVNTGSSSEYGPKHKPMKETDICEPMSAYAISKLTSTLYGSFIAKIQNRPIVALRLFSPFGPFDSPERLIPSVIIKALRNENILLSNPRGVRDFIFIEDVVKVYLKLINQAVKLKGEIFNVGSGEETSVSKVVNIIYQLTKSKSKLKWGEIPPRPWDITHWQSDTKKIQRFLNWKPRYTIKKGIKKTIQWYKNNLSLYKNEN